MPFPTKEEKAADRAIRHNDEYAVSMKRQAQGLPCWRCNSLWGHYAHCVLITGGPKYTEDQLAKLRELGLKEDEGWSFKPENDGLPSRHCTWVEFCIRTHPYPETIKKLEETDQESLANTGKSSTTGYLIGYLIEGDSN
jgi:hypothetical protein